VTAFSEGVLRYIGTGDLLQTRYPGFSRARLGPVMLKCLFMVTCVYSAKQDGQR